MPADDVSDLKDVFDAINKLCETMKSSDYADALQEDERPDGDGVADRGELEARAVRAHTRGVVRSPDEERSDSECARSQFVSAEDLSVQRMETQRQKWRESQASLASSEVSAQREAAQEERWSDPQPSPPSSGSAQAARDCARPERWSDCRLSPPALEDAETVTSDTEPAVHFEPISDVYYTASSEVSVLSDSEPPDRQPDAPDKEEGKEVVIAGHVAAMRERFESMTRANTPCAECARASSPAPVPALTPSPDLLR